MQQKKEGLNLIQSQEESVAANQTVSPILQKEELNDHVTFTAEEIAMEPVEGGGCGYISTCSY